MKHFTQLYWLIRAEARLVFALDPGDRLQRGDVLHGQKRSLRVVDDDVPRAPGIQDRNDAAGCCAQKVGQITLAKPMRQSQSLRRRSGFAGCEVKDLPSKADFQGFEGGILEQLVGSPQALGNHPGERFAKCRTGAEGLHKQRLANFRQLHTAFRNSGGRAKPAVDDADLTEYFAEAKHLDHQSLAVLVDGADTNPPVAGDNCVDGISRVTLLKDRGAISRFRKDTALLQPDKLFIRHIFEHQDRRQQHLASHSLAPWRSWRGSSTA